jgi:hypothetical protein
VKLQAMWRALPEPQGGSAERGASRLRGDAILHRQGAPEGRAAVYQHTAGPIGTAWQPLVDLEEIRNTRRIAESSIPGSCR